MIEGVCQECGTPFIGEAETGYVEDFCSLACEEASEDNEETEDE